jgi:hypothetical protein
VRRRSWYTGAFVVLGGSVLVSAGASFAAGDGGVGPLVLAAGGSVLLLTAGYQAFRREPDEFSVDTGALLLLLGAAALALVGTVLDVVG